MSKDLDIVVFGASGYTGKLVVEYLKNEYGENGSLKWAIAGRDETKLTAVKEELSLGNDLETVILFLEGGTLMMGKHSTPLNS